LQTAKEHLEASMRLMQEDIQRMNTDYEEQIYRWKQERAEIIAQNANIGKAVDKLREEVNSQRAKSRGYKDKLRLANSAIKTLSNKIVQYESERNAAHPSSGVAGHGTMSEELIRVGGLNIEGGGRDSNNSNRGSEAAEDIKQAI